MIVQENRVAAAACFLPLTVNPRVSRELGTRHRAAIGLTEENDAVAVVVSEETGQIRSALDGRIERGSRPTSCATRLRTLIRCARAAALRAASATTSRLDEAYIPSVISASSCWRSPGRRSCG